MPKPKKPVNDDYVSAAEAARLLGVKPKTIRTWRDKRHGPPWRLIAGRAVYSKDAVYKWASEHPAEHPGEDARVFLRKALTKQPREARDVKTAAEMQGICPATLARARRAIDVKTFRLNGVWIWSL